MGNHPPPAESPGYDNKQSDGLVPVMLELWEMRKTTSLPSRYTLSRCGSTLLAPICESTGTKIRTYAKVHELNRSVLIFKQRIYTQENCLK